MTPKQEEAADLFDRRMQEATGYSLEQYERVRAVGPTSLAHVQLYGRLVDESGAVEALERWAAEDRKSNAGRKAHIPFRALLILHLMHTDAGSNRYHDVAKTLFARLTPETFAYLGITVTGAAAAVTNMRRIVTFLTDAARQVLNPKQLRARRRRDEHGNRLEHPATASELRQ